MSESPNLVDFHDLPFQVTVKNITKVYRALVPGTWEELEELFFQAYKDTLWFFKTEGVCASVCVCVCVRACACVCVHFALCILVLMAHIQHHI